MLIGLKAAEEDAKRIKLMLDKLEASNIEMTSVKEKLTRSVCFTIMIMALASLCTASRSCRASEASRSAPSRAPGFAARCVIGPQAGCQHCAPRPSHYCASAARRRVRVCIVVSPAHRDRWLSVPKNNNLKKFGWESRFAILLPRPICFKLYSSEEMNDMELMFGCNSFISRVSFRSV
jgi:hypothetical protein